MSLLQELRKNGDYIRIYDPSWHRLANGELVMVSDGVERYLAVSGDISSHFHGVRKSGYLLCPTNHENRLALNELLPFTAPVSFGREGSTFGFGDRLGFANTAQIRAVRKTNVRPVLAQQSLRELQLTSRSIEQVIDAASYAVLQENYRAGYACDGDHLKTPDEVKAGIASGATMITLDCSLVLQPLADQTDEQWVAFYKGLPEQRRARDRADYLENDVADTLGLHFDVVTLAKLHWVYAAANALIRDVYFSALLPAGRPIDFEISLDETVETTTPEAHFFVAREMEREKVVATSVAPKFVGEFQKAIEYIGDLDELRATMSVHAAIAEHFGYRLSLHSGSEKFAVLPLIAELTHGHYHVKTSGTSWLEVVEVISKHAPALYRKMHTLALEGIDEAKKSYVVHCDVQKVRPLREVSDEELPEYLLHNDSRQLMHITYGYILRHEDVHQEILHFLKTNRALYEAEAEELYDRHFAALRA